MPADTQADAFFVAFQRAKDRLFRGRAALAQRATGSSTALQPYVAMRGISEGVVRASDLHPGR
jgi:hypothetical protein